MARPDYQLLHFNEGKPDRTHDFAQVYLPVNALLTVQVNHKMYKISPRELGFLPPGTPHHCLLQGDLIVMNIPLSMIKKGDLEILSSKFVYPVEDSLKPLIELIRAEIGRKSSSMRYLYYYLYDRLVENNSFRSIRFIREHFDEPVSVAQLAKLENYNIAYFNDWFKQQTGCTPSHFLRLYRIEKAKELLKYTSYRTIEIAMQVGYNSDAAFSRAFKKMEGVSPSEYRSKAGKLANY